MSAREKKSRQRKKVAPGKKVAPEKKKVAPGKKQKVAPKVRKCSPKEKTSRACMAPTGLRRIGLNRKIDFLAFVSLS